MKRVIQCPNLTNSTESPLSRDEYVSISNHDWMHKPQALDGFLEGDEGGGVEFAPLTGFMDEYLRDGDETHFGLQMGCLWG